MLVFFRCPAPALLAGNLPLGYCAAKFAGGIPTWRLPAAYGQVARLITEGEEPGEVEKRVRLNRKTPAHFVMQGSVGVQSRSRVWKRLCIRVVESCDRTDPKRRRLH